jgi:D-beta-D-heptose 7-phosphate kinase / D-beta-D-heptose 1-phosphate adenosyltransferase
VSERLRVVASNGSLRRSETRSLVVIGDALLDRDIDGSVERLAPDAPVPVLDQADSSVRPGGAGLAALLAAREGLEVVLVTALAHDAAAEELRRTIRAEGIELIELTLSGSTPEKVRLRSEGRTLMRLDRGGGYASGTSLPELELGCLDRCSALLVSDYGRGVAAHPLLRAALEKVVPRAPIVWDPHPRGPEPLAGMTVVTPNEAEAAQLSPGDGREDLGETAQLLLTRWAAGAVCITRGAAGALLARPAEPPLAVRARPVEGGDPCGAGDRFAARLAGALAAGAALDDATVAAVESASEFVAAGGAGGLRPSDSDDECLRIVAEAEDASAIAARVRAHGGVVVATGGCFDLLHAGHVRTLEAARALGDCLIVCVNSDSSVRRLKGPRRPLVPQEDRAAVLAALACVDAVVVFEEDTPSAALEALRPEIWVKGGDYEGAELPEQRTLAGWGGRTVLLPLFEGRSTTGLIEAARRPEAVAQGHE